MRKPKDFPFFALCGECDCRFIVRDNDWGRKCFVGDGRGPLCACCYLAWLDKHNRLPDKEAEKRRVAVKPVDPTLPF